MSKEEMDSLIAENKDHAVVIELANSIRFTFAKGTMKAVDGYFTIRQSHCSDYVVSAKAIAGAAGGLTVAGKKSRRF